MEKFYKSVKSRLIMEWKKRHCRIKSIILSMIVSIVFTIIVIYNNAKSNIGVEWLVGFGGMTFNDNPVMYSFMKGIVPFIVVFIISFVVIYIICWIYGKIKKK